MQHVATMSDQVQFEGDYAGIPKFTSRTVIDQPQVPGMAAWLQRKGLIREEASAKSVLLGIVVFNFLAAGLIFYFFVL